MAGAPSASVFTGRISDGKSEQPIVGAMVSFRQGDPIHEVTVFSDDRGVYRSPSLIPGESYRLRVRRIGWRDARVAAQRAPEAGEVRSLDLRLEGETDPTALANQLPANRWYALVLAELSNAEEREELVRQCTYCHKKGMRRLGACAIERSGARCWR